MKKLFRVSFALVGVICIVMAFSTNAGATGGGYTPGVEGVMAATVPPPGFHYRMYNVLYQADTLTDDNGDEIPIGFEVNVLAQAHRLQGKLLLVVGEMDRNVDPASTMQVVNALIKADKDFDLLVVPGGGHGIAESPYGKRRRRDFFVRHLLGVEPRNQP